MFDYKCVYNSLFNVQPDIIKKMQDITAELVRAQHLVDNRNDGPRGDAHFSFGYDDFDEQLLAAVEACR